MSLDPIPELKQAAEEVAGKAIEQVGQQAAGILPALVGYELVIRISLERKP